MSTRKERQQHMTTQQSEKHTEPSAPVPVLANNRGVVLSSLDEMWRWARFVIDSGLAPSGFNHSAVIVATQMGFELGLSPMCALQNIACIKGKPGLYGDAALALVQNSGLLEDYDERPGAWCDACELEGTRASNWKCPRCEQDLRGEDFKGFIVTSKRKGRNKPLVSGFNVRQAKQAGIWGQNVWKTYPNRMLKFRARGFNLRDNFPDVLKGFRTTEELQDYPDVIEHPKGRPVPLAALPATENGGARNEDLSNPKLASESVSPSQAPASPSSPPVSELQAAEAGAITIPSEQATQQRLYAQGERANRGQLTRIQGWFQRLSELRGADFAEEEMVDAKKAYAVKNWKELSYEQAEDLLAKLQAK
jgi:hypothetical protein